jgi:phosphatidylglycerophosphatase A
MQRVVATWFGTGLILGRVRGSDNGSGTVASAFAMLVWWALTPFEWWAQLVVAALVTALSVWSARPFSGAQADPPWVVVDEAAGALVATIGLVGWPVVVAWTVFRMADILKRVFPGVAAAERLPGAIGVTADDLVAGLYGLGAGWALHAMLS